MKTKACLFILMLGCCLSVYAQKRAGNKSTNVIFDTDMGPDYDDVGAIALLHYFASTGQAKILATMASTKYERVGPVLSVLNTYFKQPDIPIGVPKGEASELSDNQKWSDSLVAKYPHQLRSNREAPDAVKLYRKVLAAQPDNSVVIITVGFFTNIADLLQSPPDELSPLSGQELVDRKVLKMVSMAGKFPSGSEFNVDEQASASKYVVSHWRKPLVFSGFEIGEKIKTGIPLIQNTAIQKSPVKDVFRISIPKAKEDAKGRMSWDQTAVLVAIKGHKPYYSLQRGRMAVNTDGSNTWENNAKGNHYHLVADRSPEEVQKVINELMMYQPENNQAAARITKM